MRYDNSYSGFANPPQQSYGQQPFGQQPMQPMQPRGPLPYPSSYVTNPANPMQPFGQQPMQPFGSQSTQSFGQQPMQPMQPRGPLPYPSSYVTNPANPMQPVGPQPPNALSYLPSYLVNYAQQFGMPLGFDDRQQQMAFAQDVAMASNPRQQQMAFAQDVAMASNPRLGLFPKPPNPNVGPGAFMPGMLPAQSQGVVRGNLTPQQIAEITRNFVSNPTASGFPASQSILGQSTAQPRNVNANVPFLIDPRRPKPIPKNKPRSR